MNTLAVFPEPVFTIKQRLFHALIFSTAKLPDFYFRKDVATKRIPIRQLREVLRLRLHAQLSLRQIRNSLKLSLGAIQKVISKADELNLTWVAIEKLNDQQFIQ